MNKELQVLETLKHLIYTGNTQEHSEVLYKTDIDKCFDTIEKALIKAQEQEKALSIIKEKEVDVKLLKLSTNWLDYYTRVKHKTGKNTELTQEEFELLKRWLNEMS